VAGFRSGRHDLVFWSPSVDFSGLINDFGPLTVTGLAQGAIIALFALGYTLVYGVLRLINFAHSEVFMMGTFACVVVWGSVWTRTRRRRLSAAWWSTC
jgi:branched-chain amino acid transport system permease protein